MYMEDIFQELLLSVGISVAVCCIIMKLKPYGEEEGDEVFKRSYAGDMKGGFSGQKSEEHPLSFDSCKNRGAWHLDEPLTAFELVEDEAVKLQDLSIEKEIVGGDDSKSLSQENCNVIDDSHVVSEIIEDVGVFETLRRREEDVDCFFERSSIHEIEEIIDNPLEERAFVDETEQGLYEDDESSEAKIEQISEILGIDRVEKEEEGMFDDWEGVERSELEKLFGAAVVFVGSKSNAGLIDRDMKIELYGLHKIAIEGPCRGTQPMALNVSARAKWDSWKRLGNMSRELAMEQYLFVLSERVPGWTRNNLPVKQSAGMKTLY